MNRNLILLLACGALGAFAGCGGGDDNPESPLRNELTPTTKTTESTPAAAKGEVVVIKMKNFAFEPKDATVQVGQKVKWVNEDDAPHNVVAENDDDLKSETFGKGKTFEYTADERGQIEYVCTLHPQMTATLNVVK